MQELFDFIQLHIESNTFIGLSADPMKEGELYVDYYNVTAASTEGAVTPETRQGLRKTFIV